MYAPQADTFTSDMSPSYGPEYFQNGNAAPAPAPFDDDTDYGDDNSGDFDFGDDDSTGTLEGFENAPAKKKAGPKHGKRKFSFAGSIRKIVKGKGAHQKITAGAISTADNLLLSNLGKIIAEASALSLRTKKATLTDKQIMYAYKVIFHNDADIAQVQSDVDKALTRYTSGHAAAPGHKLSSSERAGLIFPVGSIHTYLKKASSASRVSVKAAIAVAAIMQDTASLIIEDAIANLRDRKTIDTRAIQLGLQKSLSLDKAFNKHQVAGGGVLPTAKVQKVQKKKKATKKAPAKAVTKKAVTKKAAKSAAPHVKKAAAKTAAKKATKKAPAKLVSPLFTTEGFSDYSYDATW